MPFVQRAVGPVRLSRAKLHDERGAPTVRDGELEAVTNCALSNALRQMASVATLADEVFRELRGQLADVAARSAGLKLRVQAVGRLVDASDPRAVTVPESDLTAFSLKTEHFKSKQVETKGLLSASNRPAWVKRLYDQAGVPSKVYANKPHVHRLSRRKRSLDDSCLPSDIELRKPASIVNLRPWTSEEVLGDVTVTPDCSSRIPRDPSPILEDQIDHKLPSPEEQQQVIAHKFPPEIVQVDISGRSFNRMSALRRSLQNVEYETSVRRRKSRRPRGKRRNTIAGTDQKELEAVIGGLSDSNKDSDDIVSSSTTVVVTEKRSNLDLLKDWGRMRLKQFKNVESTSTSVSVKLREKGKIGLARRKWDKDEPVHSSSGNWSASSESGQSTSTSHIPRSSVSSCSGGSTRPIHQGGAGGGSSVTSDEGETGSTYSCDTEGYYTSFHVDSGLKTLREEEPPAQHQPPRPMSALHTTSALTCGGTFLQSSSSAESEYDVFGRGSTSTTASSAGTVCTSLLVSPQTSQYHAPPPPPDVPERGGSKLSSAAADAYGGSLPKDSAAAAAARMLLLRDKSNTAPSRLTKENVTTRYDGGGGGRPLMVDVRPGGPSQGQGGGGESPDSGHNTCSSPVDSVVTSPSVDLETSECSDLEGVDRVERLRVKTAIDTSRIPSMCVITPPISDDDYGEYVTLACVAHEPSAASPPSSRRAAAPAVVAGFVHMDRLPGAADRPDGKKTYGARVTLDADGRVVYTSDSLKRRRKTHTTNTFEPGPCVVGGVAKTAATQITVASQAAPRSPTTVRPVTKRNAVQPSPVERRQNAVQPSPVERKQNAAPELRPLVPVPLPCSPGQKRSAKTLDGRQRPVAARVVVVSPDRRPAAAVSPPMISPTRRSLSPKEVVKGAYVRMQDPTECLETSLDEGYKPAVAAVVAAVKRSDSYRQANANSPRPVKSPPTETMLMALQKASNNHRQHNNIRGTTATTDVGHTPPDAGRQRNVSAASTPVRDDDRNAGRTIDMSNDNISPIRDLRTSPSAVRDDRQRVPPPAVVVNRRCVGTAGPPVRPASGRSAMDLYAAIHESKKRLLGHHQPAAPVPARRIVDTTVPAAPRRIVDTTVPAARRSPPERPSPVDRYRPRDDRRSAARYDFKRLLLQTNMAGGRRAQQSAVVRLQQPPPPPPPHVPSSNDGGMAGGRARARGPYLTAVAGGRKVQPRRAFVSTIQEDCGEDENGGYGEAAVPKSSALVNSAAKTFAASTTCSALETAL